MRAEFEMTEEEFQTILDAGKPVPAMWLSGGRPMFDSPQENANRAWKLLGAKRGFVWDSVQPVPGKSHRFFTAETIAIEQENP